MTMKICKKQTKRIPGILLLVICCLAAVFADWHNYTDAVKTIPCSDDGIILSIVTYDGQSESSPLIPSLGHSWIALENHLSHSIRLLDYILAPGEALTVSAWAIHSHFGVVFNLEAAYIREKGRYDGRQSVSTNITEAQLSVIEDYITQNDDWRLTRNCSYWSIHLWNLLVPEALAMKTQTLLYTPARLQKSFGEFTHVETNRDFSSAKGIFFYTNALRTEAILCD